MASPTRDLDLPALMAKAKLSGLALASLRGGELETVESHGVADAAAGRRVDDETVFEAASLGKPVFAYAALKCVEADLISLDEPILRFVTDRIEHDELTAQITARHVLSHTTGLPNWRSELRPMKCHFPPGHRFSYSGEGYLLLQRALETILGEPLDGYMRRLVFEPLGMSHYDAANVPEDVLALPHDENGAPTRSNTLSRNAAGSLHTTAADYARFLRVVLRGEGLSPEARQEMLRPTSRPPTPFLTALDPVGDPPLADGVAWGLGWGLEIGCDRIFHWGSNPGFKSFTLNALQDGTGFVVLSTGETELSLGPAIAAALLPGDQPALRWFG